MTISVVLVASVAAWISYFHAVEVVKRAGGESNLSAHLLPATIDGLAGSASLVMLFCARYKLPVPRLARVAMAMGIGATLSANILHGLDHGTLAAVIAGWPALSLMVSYELAMWIVAASRSLETRTVVTLDKPEVVAREQLATALTMLAAEPKISGAELARRTGMSYPLALETLREARDLVR